ncbi:predicted protein [Arabidopsis lyrata subsp. lyrata]|uniref:Predicted protein n=1 Tax=Arabidopsis lyrata subsp. lyrata TaxID=81972 RepID=D7KQ16_ARALL|nr:predicted protein [Arabidopsis lyrata subsp. lyrata]
MVEKKRRRREEEEEDKKKRENYVEKIWISKRNGKVVAKSSGDATRWMAITKVDIDIWLNHFDPIKTKTGR